MSDAARRRFFTRMPRKQRRLRSINARAPVRPTLEPRPCPIRASVRNLFAPRPRSGLRPGSRPCPYIYLCSGSRQEMAARTAASPASLRISKSVSPSRVWHPTRSSSP